MKSQSSSSEWLIASVILAVFMVLLVLWLLFLMYKQYWVRNITDDEESHTSCIVTAGREEEARYSNILHRNLQACLALSTSEGYLR